MTIEASYKIPNIFHIIRLEGSAFSEEERQSLRFWQSLNPKWSFELWTFSSKFCVPFTEMKTHLIPESTKGIEQLCCEILFANGGVWFDLGLCACKSLEAIASNRTLLMYSKDRKSFSLLGACPKHPALEGFFQKGAIALFEGLEKSGDVLEKFALPEGIFTPLAPQSELEGVCFWKFGNQRLISERQCEIIRSQVERTQSMQKVLLLISKMHRKLLCLSALFFLDGVLLCLYGSLLAAIGILFLGGISYLTRKKKRVSLSQSAEVSLFHRLCCRKPPYPCSAQDYALLQMYESLYERHFSLDSKEGESIPRVAHFIWLGDQPFPRESLSNLLSWRRLHPHWTFKFWTDQKERPAPFDWMQEHWICDLELPHLGKLQSNNFAEQSDLLRYEILFQEGGIYVDHDVECFRSFDPLVNRLDFFAFLEPIHESEIPDLNCIITNCLIGAKAHHPILEDTMRRVVENWDRYEKMFPHEDQPSTLFRVLHRTFNPFILSVHEKIGSQMGKNIVLPAACLFSEHLNEEVIQDIKNKGLLFANHQWKNEWMKRLPTFKGEAGLDQLETKLNRLSKILHFLLIGGVILLGCFFLEKIGQFWVKSPYRI